jgi:2-keto-4-pentenoate hydratase/2-oxohepta-3-ene-1,7-dioic acid hydratase in catechol pathway
LIEHWPTYADRIRSIKPVEHRLSDVRLHAPIARPGKIFAIGLNYADHAAEAGLEVPKEQFWFTKPGTAVNGPFDPIERPIVSEALDYEVELIAVIGQRCRHLTAVQAKSAIFGYCVGNDVSVRDWQTRTTQVTLGKSFDTHAPFGPWIVTADAVDPADLEISSFVNNQRRQYSRTRHLIFDVFAQIIHLSKVMTLEPGDIVFTGTPSGVGAAMKPASWLRPGDIVRCEIENIGAIENRVIDEQKRVRRVKDS